MQGEKSNAKKKTNIHTQTIYDQNEMSSICVLWNGFSSHQIYFYDQWVAPNSWAFAHLKSYFCVTITEVIFKEIVFFPPVVEKKKIRSDSFVLSMVIDRVIRQNSVGASQMKRHVVFL